MKKLLFGLVAISSVAFAGGKGEVIVAPAPVIVEDTWPAWSFGLYGGAGFANKFDFSATEKGATGVADKISRKADGDSVSWEAGLEAAKNITENFALGLGAAYQGHGDIKSKSATINGNTIKQTGPSFDSTALYGFGKYAFGDFDSVRPYVRGDIGYSFNTNEKDFRSVETNAAGTVLNDDKFSADVDNGLYWGAGAGVEYGNWFTQVMYKQNKGDLTLTDKASKTKYTGKADNSRVVLDVGYRFNF